MKKDVLGTVVLVAIVAICVYIWYATSDFALALVLVTAAFFVIWLGDKLLFARRRRQRSGTEGEKAREPVLVDYARSFFPVILAVLVFRTFLLEPFRIPSGSMMPTLLVGDFVLVNKFAYGLRLPVTNTKILDTGEPHRGDIAVFRYPGFTCHRGGEVMRGGDPTCTTPVPKEDYIKRIIGLPGDTITVKGEQIFVDGKPMQQKLIGPYHGTDKVSIRMEENPNMSPVTLHMEDLGDVEHHILQFGYVETETASYRLENYCVKSGGTHVQGGCQWIVPRGDYFAMGDDRDNSEDSRFWGFVPEKNLAGKAFLIWFSLADWHRIGTVLH